MRLLFSIIALSLMSGSLTAGHAASFDCDNASKADEVAVCRNRDLSNLDTEMGALWFSYGKIPMLMGANGARHDAAEDFLSKRAACAGDINCLRILYQSRIAALRENIGAAMDNIRRQENDTGSASSLPSSVENIIAGYAGECRGLGGTLKAGADRPKIMSSDLDGDGTPDYVLNPQNLQCSASATAFCGNGGCNIRVAISSRNYQDPVAVLGGQPMLSQGQDDTYVEVWTDGANCNAPDRTKACWMRMSWKDGKMSKSYRTRPLPN